MKSGTRGFSKELFLVFYSVLLLSGCIRFTEKDYDLQEKAYQKQRAEEKIADQEKIQLHW